jgi:hypothetical protein
MKLRLQFGGVPIALGLSVAMALPCAAQNHNANRPPQQQRQAPRQAPRQGQRQPQGGRRAQNGRPNNDRLYNNAAANRQSPNKPTESMGMIGGNRPPNAGPDSGRSNLNSPNRPPNVTGSQARPRQYRDLSPEQKRSYDQFRKLPPQKQQQIRDAARAWGKLTPEQQNHIKTDVLPSWKLLPPARRNSIESRLNVLQNMPESARNQHLNDPNFTRGMSEEDKAMLRDLAHMHMGAPDQPNE